MPGAKINLGCGFEKLEGYVNVDIDSDMQPDVIADFNRPLPFKNRVAEHIICKQVLEHIPDYTSLMFEIHRILDEDGKVEFSVPKFPCMAAIADPDHVRFFISETFMHFCNPNWFNPSNFRGKGLFDWSESKEIKWKNKGEADSNAGRYFTELIVELKKANGKYRKDAPYLICIKERQ